MSRKLPLIIYPKLFTSGLIMRYNMQCFICSIIFLWVCYQMVKKKQCYACKNQQRCHHRHFIVLVIEILCYYYRFLIAF